MPSPRPGHPVRGSTTGRPIMALLDLLGRRWALRIGWELRDGPLGFREIQERCGGISPSVLSTRLKELVEATVVTTNEDGNYALTDEGEELAGLLLPLDEWAKRWGRGSSRTSL